MNKKIQDSMVDIAYLQLKASKDSKSFKAMWDHVCSVFELDEAEKLERVSLFYTNLSLDGRFVTLGENMWDLREKHTYDKVHIDMNAIYAETEDLSLLLDDYELETDEEGEYEIMEDKYEDEDY